MSLRLILRQAQDKGLQSPMNVYYTAYEGITKQLFALYLFYKASIMRRMKLKQIEEIATRTVPIWQPVLLVALLLLGTFAIPLIAQKDSQVQKKESLGTTLGISNIKDKINNEVKNIVLPLSENIQKETGVVMGVAQKTVQQTVQNIASQSASQAKEFVFDNTIGKVLQNINTLPLEEQELIKKAICK